jgi:anti-anti-sigma factor
MLIEIEKVGQVSVLRVKDRLVRGTGDVELRAQVTRLLEEGERRFLLDLRTVPYMDSAAVGETVACAKRAHERNGKIKLLVEAKGKIDDMLRLTSMDRVFDLLHDEREAIASFAD